MTLNRMYFDSYADLQVHEILLKDSSRVETYKNAISQNIDLIKGKSVLDIGAGTGILSLFCAKAGAKIVYAVEANPSLIPIIQKLAEDNNLSDVIEVLCDDIENISLPENVDVIISEWMGFYLLHEGMLNSVLYSKKFLNEGGIMLPDESSIYFALCELPQYFDSWDNIYELNFSAFGKEFRESMQSKPQICIISADVLLSEPLEAFSFRLMNINEKDLEKLSGDYVLPAKRAGKFQGLCIWFKVSFNNKGILSTSPFDPPTHWKQTVIVLPSEIILEENEPVAFTLNFIKKERAYEISFQLLDSDEVEHRIPCSCYNVKCRIISSYLNKD